MRRPGNLTALLAFGAAAQAAGGTASAAGLPPYGQSIRCAGLAEGAARLTDPASAEGRRLYDAAIFWGLAASEAARDAKLPASRFTRDQKDAAKAGRAELESGSPGAAAELKACLDAVPPSGR
jgi:hypothetical protein